MPAAPSCSAPTASCSPPRTSSLGADKGLARASRRSSTGRSCACTIRQPLTDLAVLRTGRRLQPAALGAPDAASRPARRRDRQPARIRGVGHRRCRLRAGTIVGRPRGRDRPHDRQRHPDRRRPEPRQLRRSARHQRRQGRRGQHGRRRARPRPRGTDQPRDAPRHRSAHHRRPRSPRIPGDRRGPRPIPPTVALLAGDAVGVSGSSRQRRRPRRPGLAGDDIELDGFCLFGLPTPPYWRPTASAAESARPARGSSESSSSPTELPVGTVAPPGRYG